MSKLQVLALIFVFLCPVALLADQIVLKNGDRLTGTIEQSDDKTLVIKTEFAGEVTVQWPAVQEINSTQHLFVTLNDGKTVTGTVTTSDGNLAVVTANAGNGYRAQGCGHQIIRRSANRPHTKNRCILGCSKAGRAGPTLDLGSPAATAKLRIWTSPSPPTARRCTIILACTPTRFVRDQ